MFCKALAMGVTIAVCAMAQTAKPAAAASPPPAQPENGAWMTKTFEMKFADPEQVRRVFGAQSHVMEVNRELKLLTAHGSAAFLKEVEDTIKRFDVARPIPPNTQITVYLVASAPQAPAGTALPAELKTLSKDLPPKLADMQMFRVRAGQAGETAGAEAAAAPAVSLARIRVESTAVNPGAKGDIVSLNGLKVWLNLPPADAAASGAKAPRNEPDVAADIDVAPDEAVIVAKLGVEKPLAVVVRVGIVK